MQFAEGDGFQHVHFHLIARSHDWPAEFKGPRIFAAWSVTNPVSADEATRVINAVAMQLGLVPGARIE